MTPKERKRAIQKWDAALRDLAHRVNDLEALEATPTPLGRKDRFAREDELNEIRMGIWRAQNLLDGIEKEFPECKHWTDCKPTTKKP